MAFKNWNTQRSIATCVDKIEDKFEIIKVLIARKHFVDDQAVDTVLTF